MIVVYMEVPAATGPSEDSQTQPCQVADADSTLPMSLEEQIYCTFVSSSDTFFEQ